MNGSAGLFVASSRFHPLARSAAHKRTGTRKTGEGTQVVELIDLDPFHQAAHSVAVELEDARHGILIEDGIEYFQIVEVKLAQIARVHAHQIAGFLDHRGF
jgi:hypothetical protein